MAGLAVGSFFQLIQTTPLARVIANIGILNWLVALLAVGFVGLFVGEVSVGLLSHSSGAGVQAAKFVFLLEFAVLKVAVFQLEVAQLAVWLCPLLILYSAELPPVLDYPYCFFVVLNPFVCV